MAGNASSGSRRKTTGNKSATSKKRTQNTTARRKKNSTSGSTASSAKRASGKNSGKRSASRNNRQKNNKLRLNEQHFSPEVFDAVKVIVFILIGCILILSVFDMFGRIGDSIAYFLYGLMGIMAKAFPLIAFMQYAFHVINRGNKLATKKILASMFFLVFLMAVFAVRSESYNSIVSIPDAYTVCGGSRIGGGIIGYTVAYALRSTCGQIGAMLILICLMIISFILIIGTNVLTAIGSGILELLDRSAQARDERTQARMAQEEYNEITDTSDDDYEDIDEEDQKVRKSVRKRKKIEAVSEDYEDIDEDLPSQSSTEKSDPADSTPLPEMGDPAPDQNTDSNISQNNAISRKTLDDPVKPVPAPVEGIRLEPVNIEIPDFLRRAEAAANAVLGTDTAEDHNAAMTDVTDDYEEDVTEDLFGDMDITSEEEMPSLPDSIRNRIDDVTGEDTYNAEAPKKTRTKTPTVKDLGGVTDVTGEINQAPVYQYRKPPLNLLDRGRSTGGMSKNEMQEKYDSLQETFNSFGVDATVKDIVCGPSVTRFEVEPGPGVRVAKIVSLTDDIKLNLAASSIRIQAPIPGKSLVGIEVPNESKQMVKLRELLESDASKNEKSKIAFCVGKDISGKTVVANIEKMPHLLIAGATGSGKSVCINTIVMSILFRADPNEVKLIMVDPKVVELNVYNGIPHLLLPVVTDPKKAAGALNWAVSEMMDRYARFAEAGAKDIKSYNARVAAGQLDPDRHRKMPQIVIIIDELADLMMVAKAEVETAIVRLAQLARACGIHLIIATQRPSVNVITGIIKANVPSRIAFMVSSQVDSRTIIDIAGAEKLLGNGDMLFHPQGMSQPSRVQGAFVSEEEIAKVVNYIKEKNAEMISSGKDISDQITSVTSASGSIGGTSQDDDRDAYFEEAGRFVIEKEKASIGMLQRVFKIGFNRAARIMDQLCDAGVVGPEIGTKPRKIIMTIEEFEEYIQNN